MTATQDGYARQIIAEGQRRGITPRGIQIALATALVESGLRMYANERDPESLKFPHEALSYDANSVGLFQQRAEWWGTVADRMDPTRSAGMFFERLAKADYNNMARSPGSFAQQVQRSAFPDRYDERVGDAINLYQRLVGTTTGDTVGFTGDPVWLEDVLRPALGDRLETLDGWRDCGHGDFAQLEGVMVHHTGNSKETAQSIRDGRPDLEGPLANLHIAPNGIVTIVAVGVCWHAGAGSYPWLPTDNANQHMIGIECAWPTIRAGGGYDPGEKWPDKQIIAMRDTCAALVKKLGVEANRVIGHKEWAGNAQGKWDPGNLSMTWFRSEVAKDMRGELDGVPKPPVVPPKPEPIDYVRQNWEQIRGRWAMLGDLTLVEAVAVLLDKELGTSNASKKGVRFD